MISGNGWGLSLPNICLGPGADQSSKAALGKSTFAKTCFLLLKIRLAHINRAKSKNAFEYILARFSRKHFVRCTCQNILESTFAFCSIGVRQSYLNKRKHVLAKVLLPKAALLDWSAPGLTVQEKPQPEKLTRLGIKPGPIRSESTMLSLDYSSSHTRILFRWKGRNFFKWFNERSTEKTVLHTCVTWGFSSEFHLCRPICLGI